MKNSIKVGIIGAGGIANTAHAPAITSIEKVAEKTTRLLLPKSERKNLGR